MTPDFSRGYLRLPLPVWLAVFCRAPLTRRQLQLVAVVIRESWGWQTATGHVRLWTRPMTTRQFTEATGLAGDHLRRDLRRLIARNVLRENAGRYQFLPDPSQWITLIIPPPKQRSLPPEWLDLNAKMAASNPASKKENRKQRNVTAFSVNEFSTPGDNSSSRSSGAAAGISAAAATRLVDVIAAFVGSLSAREAEALRQWIAEAGVAVVWRSLEPSFRLGSVAGRRHLEAILSLWLQGHRQ